MQKAIIGKKVGMTQIFDEAGKVIDMIKDLAEAEEKGWKACYYKTIIDDMYSYDQNDRMGYDNWRYSSGRFAPKGKGHYSGFTAPYVSMPEPIMTDRMGYYEEYVEAKDHYHSTHSTDDKNKMIEKAKAKGVNFLLPVDHRVAAEFKDVEAKVTEGQDIPDGFMGLDIGPKTEKLYADAIKDAKTVVWNGPMGVFEFENYNKGTIAVAKAMADADATTVIGGGDSAAAVNILGFGDKMTHISTGGGASLEFLEGKTLPGIAALNDK